MHTLKCIPRVKQIIYDFLQYKSIIKDMPLKYTFMECGFKKDEECLHNLGKVLWRQLAGKMLHDNTVPAPRLKILPVLFCLFSFFLKRVHIKGEMMTSTTENKKQTYLW